MDNWEKILSSPELESEESVIAIRLAEALRADEVEKFLEIYDSIPASTNAKRVQEIKEMARQLAALPKKQFELYRSKKILSSDHGFLHCGGNQVVKDKLGANYISKTAFYEMNALQKGLGVSHTVKTNNAAVVKDNENNPGPGGNKKRKKSKKGKLSTSTNSSQNGTEEQGTGTVDLKQKFVALDLRSPLCVSMNKNLVADISTGTELKTKKNSIRNTINLGACEMLEKDNEDVSPKEMNKYFKDVDSGLGSYASPLLPKEPPFGFPLSSQKLLESAVRLLPSLTCDEDNSSNNIIITAEKDSHVTELPNPEDDSKQMARTSLCNIQVDSSEKDKTLQILEQTEGKCTQHQEIEDDPVSDISDSKEICKEGDSVDGDVSSSSAVEDNEGWQSQTKRSYRKKKKELVATRTGREKNHMDRFQRKENYRQQSDMNQFRKNYYYKKSFDDKKNYGLKPATRTMSQDMQQNKGKAAMKYPSLGCHSNVQAQGNMVKGNVLKSERGFQSCSGKTVNQNEMITPKKLSYRDVLLKNKTKVEPVYSSDSGVDVNSISSCESSSVSPDAQKESFNKQECADYLCSAWKKVMSDAKQGLVICFSVGTDPLECEKQRKRHVTVKKTSSSRP